MVITETKEINGKEFTYNYSDEGYYIRKAGTDEIYMDAYDLPDMNYIYEEAEYKIGEEPEEELEEE